MMELKVVMRSPTIFPVTPEVASKIDENIQRHGNFKAMVTKMGNRYILMIGH